MIHKYNEGNELICKFMGFTGWNERNHFAEFGYYHTSWDWLMPVVEKINNLTAKNWLGPFVEINCDQCRIEILDNRGYEHGNIYFNAVEHNRKDVSTTINSLWVAIIQFIQWYNLQTSKQ